MKSEIVSSIEASEESSLSGFIKSLPEDILDKISDPLECRYSDHLYYYCHSYDDTGFLWDEIDLDGEYQKIRDRDYDNLLVYFNPEQLYYYGEEEKVFGTRRRRA